MSMYVRLKRKNQSVFMHVEPSDSFASLKERCAQLFSTDADKVILFADDKKKELVDMATVSDQEIKNDDIIYMCLQKPSGGFEDIQVDHLAPFGDADEEEGKS